MSARLLTAALAIALVALPTPAVAGTGSTVYVTDFQDNDVAVVSGNAVTDTIPVADQGGGIGANPTQTTLSPDGSLVYVLASGPAPGQRGSITKISTATGRYVGRFRLANPASRFVLTPDGHQAFLLDRTKITALDLSTGRATSLGGPAPIDEALSPDGRTLYVANDGGTGLTVIDTATDTVTGQLTTGGPDAAVAVSADSRTVYALSDDDTVQVIDAASGTMTATVPVPASSVVSRVGGQRIVVTPDGHELYVYSIDSKTYTVIDTATNTVIGTITPPARLTALAFAAHGGSQAYGIGGGDGFTFMVATGAVVANTTAQLGTNLSAVVLSDDDTHAEVVDKTASTLTTIGVGIHAFSQTLGVGAGPDGVVLDHRGRAYTANALSSTVTVVDVANARITEIVASEFLAPNAIAISPDGSTAYLTGFVGSDVRVVDTATNKAVARVTKVGPEPNAITFAPDGQHAYVTSAANTVAVIVTSARRASTPIRVGNAPHGVAVSPDSIFVYVANSGDGTLSVIDTRPNGLPRTIPVGANAANPLAAPDGSTVYVTAGGGIAVVNVVTGTVTGTIGPRGANAAALTPNGATLYVIESGKIQAIATATNTVTATIPVAAQHVALSPDGTHLHALTRDSVVTVDTATNTITGTAKLGLRNWSGLAVR